ncbi:hypothetical protein VNO80_28732 [Phaseolus coccineus]|uniref:NodB homology domain-containing protein n=1 Tax=Phaseolus coccineus TaxID=3886 RepID=A0AAN9QEC5_PHACN
MMFLLILSAARMTQGKTSFQLRDNPSRIPVPIRPFRVHDPPTFILTKSSPVNYGSSPLATVEQLRHAKIFYLSFDGGYCTVQEDLELKKMSL